MKRSIAILIGFAIVIMAAPKALSDNVSGYAHVCASDRKLCPSETPQNTLHGVLGIEFVTSTSTSTSTSTASATASASSSETGTATLAASQPVTLNGTGTGTSAAALTATFSYTSTSTNTATRTVTIVSSFTGTSTVVSGAAVTATQSATSVKTFTLTQTAVIFSPSLSSQTALVTGTSTVVVTQSAIGTKTTTTSSTMTATKTATSSMTKTITTTISTSFTNTETASGTCSVTATASSAATATFTATGTGAYTNTAAASATLTGTITDTLTTYGTVTATSVASNPTIAYDQPSAFNGSERWLDVGARSDASSGPLWGGAPYNSYAEDDLLAYPAPGFSALFGCCDSGEGATYCSNYDNSCPLLDNSVPGDTLAMRWIPPGTISASLWLRSTGVATVLIEFGICSGGYFTYTLLSMPFSVSPSTWQLQTGSAEIQAGGLTVPPNQSLCLRMTSAVTSGAPTVWLGSSAGHHSWISGPWR
jgi:hypothetical protein